MKLAAGIETDLQEAAAVVDRQAATLAPPLTALISELHRHPPRLVVTCARGSPKHRNGIPPRAQSERTVVRSNFAIRSQRRPDRDCRDGAILRRDYGGICKRS